MSIPPDAGTAGSAATPPEKPAALSGIYPPALMAEEWKLIEKRRKHWRGTAAEKSPVIAGLALSGGGIRSATFCLGFMQALAKRDLLGRFDFMSTVSGGGYVGSFFGAWIHNEKDAKAVQARLPESASAPVKFLRNNGRYLAPNGSADAMAAMAAHLRSWLTVWLVLGLVALGGFMMVEAGKLALGHKAWLESLKNPAPAENPQTVAAKPGGVPNERAAGATGIASAPVSTAAPAVAETGTGGATAAPEKKSDKEESVWKTALSYVRWSPLFKVVVWTLLLFALPPAVAYWYATHARGSVAIWMLLAGIGAALGYGCKHGMTESWRLESCGALWWTYGWTIVLALYALLTSDHPELPRNRLNDMLATALSVAAALVALAVVDTIGLSLTTREVWSAAILPVLAAAAQGLLPRLMEGTKEETPAWLSSLLIPAGALLVALVAFGVLSLEAHQLARVLVADASPVVAPWVGIADGTKWAHLLIILAAVFICLGLGAMVGFSFAFVNLSSHHRMYSARITRTYLGASNPNRTAEVKPKAAAAQTDGTEAMHAPETSQARMPVYRNPRDVTAAMPGDRIEFLNYRPHAHGGPLHLVNVTVNETIDGISQIEQKDRKGFSLAVGPLGLSARTMDHALFQTEAETAGKKLPKGRALLQPAAAKTFHTLATTAGGPISVEMPTVGGWAGISGAAFTTGLGARTNPAISFLLGFFNVRLGYWWDSGIAPSARKARAERGTALAGDFWSWAFPAQAGLLDEWMARFRGAARQHWYLSDGGHFENCAVYELMRRRVPLIVCCDCGADPEYTFEDLGNLVRKARIDYGAEIVFWDDATLAAAMGGGAWADKYPGIAAAVGPLPELALQAEGPGKNLSSKNVALAWITYGDGQRSLLVVAKPTLSPDAPVDLLNYDSTESAFPQQSTLDQFFDEEQWESYRKLGSFIGAKLFPEGGIEWDKLAEIAAGGRPLAAQLQPV